MYPHNQINKNLNPKIRIQSGAAPTDQTRRKLARCLNISLKRQPESHEISKDITANCNADEIYPLRRKQPKNV